MSKINIVLDATMLDTFQSCPCKYDYRFNLNKTTPDKARSLDRGDLVHIGLEAYYNTLKDRQDLDTCIIALRKAIRVRSSEESLLPLTEVGRIIEVAEESVTRFRNQDENIQIIAVEKPFSYILHEDEHFRIIMIGKIDLLWSDNVYTNCPTDHKTYERDFPLDKKSNQFSNYAYAMKSNFLFVNRIGFQTSIAPEKKHKRVPLSYDPIFLDQWKWNTVKWAMMYYDCCVDNSWPMNMTSCFKFNRMCEYDDVCNTSGNENKIYKLEANFKTAPKWDVSASLGKKND